MSVNVAICSSLAAATYKHRPAYIDRSPVAFGDGLAVLRGSLRDGVSTNKAKLAWDKLEKWIAGVAMLA